jgi:hypothetical protein
VSKVYVALVEVERLPGCTRLSDDELGAFARCYATAADADAAEQRVRDKLGAEHLGVVDVEWCEPFEDTAWEDDESEEAEECAREARDSGAVVVGRLDTWCDEEEPSA